MSEVKKDLILDIKDLTVHYVLEEETVELRRLTGTTI